MHTCICTAEAIDEKTRKLTAYMIDGDQYSQYLYIEIPKEFPLPELKDHDYFYVDPAGVKHTATFPYECVTTEHKVHVKIGYDYAYDVKHIGKFKLMNPVYLGEVKAKSCSTITRLKKK